jgi:hypothetical protein
MPLMILGWEYTTVFWSKNWFLPIMFAGVLAVLNTYFITNWRLFTLLEKENWDQLIALLEDSVYRKKHYRAQQLRVLVNAYLVKSDLESIGKLEAFLKEHSPKKLESLSLQFGIPYLLKNETKEMEQFFGTYRTAVRGEEKGWMDWNYGFSLLLNQKKEDAVDALVRLLDSTKVPLLKLLTAYLLDGDNDTDEQVRRKVTASVLQLQKRFGRAGLEKEAEKSRSNVEVVILSKLISDALEWMDRFTRDLN